MAWFKPWQEPREWVLVIQETNESGYSTWHLVARPSWVIHSDGSTRILPIVRNPRDSRWEKLPMDGRLLCRFA